MNNIRRRVSLATILVAVLSLTGCSLIKDSIAVSEDVHDFRSNRQSWNLEVWNSSHGFSRLTMSVTASEEWIHVSPTRVSSTGPDDVKLLTVTVNRQGLARGVHEGHIELSSFAVKSVQVKIRLYSDGSEGVMNGDLNILNIAETFSAPYLLDFTFSLRNRDNVPVIGEPNQFRVTCMEDGVPISAEENPPYLGKASSKQFRGYLVLDYSASMASIQAHGDSNHDGKSDAIEAMENAAENVFLPALSGDALIGVYEFHRETPPERVCAPSTDKQFVSERIDAIWPQIVRSFWGASRCWDAVYAAVGDLGQENQNDENRNIILVSDGRDTSSMHTREQVIDFARQRGARVHAIGFGQDADVGSLQALTDQTNGGYYSALAVQDLGHSFLQIVDDLAGQYMLRWATLKRADTDFQPSFLVALAAASPAVAAYTSPFLFEIGKYAGDELSGVLRVVPSRSGDKSTYFLRASYVPRYIWKLRFYVESLYPFTVEKVGATDGGLCAGWSESITTDPIRGGKWIYLESPDVGNIDSPLPFASFGPILRIDFNQVFDDDVTPFDVLYVDNTLYDAVQSFTIQGWNNILP